MDNRPEVIIETDEDGEIVNVHSNNMTDKERVDIAVTLIGHVVNQTEVYPPQAVEIIKDQIINYVKEM